jgi:hypothetical protein
VTRRRGRRRKQLLDDLGDRRGYSHLKLGIFVEEWTVCLLRVNISKCNVSLCFCRLCSLLWECHFQSALRCT